MATTIYTAISSALIDGKAPLPRQSAASSQCVTLPTFPPPQFQHQHSHRGFTTAWKATAYCGKIARNVVAMATREAPTAMATREAPTEVAAIELPELIKPLQEAWEKVEDKYAVSSLAAAGAVALWGSTGMILAIDRLPIVPGVLELVGIGYTGWFVYKNLIFKPDREALIAKIKSTYGDIIGTS